MGEATGVAPKLTLKSNLTFVNSFVYAGNNWTTGLHSEPASGVLIQLANTKRWRFVEPRYDPYLHPIRGIKKATQTQSEYDFIPDDVGFQYIDVDTRAGDLIVFPPFWWHTVLNM